MGDEGFLKRWARRKSESRQGQEPAPEPAPESAPSAALLDIAPPADADAHADAPAPAREEAGRPAPPTMADVALLTPQSDFSSFVARGVDADVRRTALKKLFADPHFNAIDRLDVYMDDYTKPSPVSEAMLASLRHAASVFERLGGDDPKDAGADTDASAVPAAVAGTSDTGAMTEEALVPALDAVPAPEPQEPHEPREEALPYQQHSPETETR